MTPTGANTDLLPVGTVWVGSQLNWIARMSLQSFLHMGHPTFLFHTDEIEDPGLTGLELINVREVWDYPDKLRERVSPTVFSDFFRLRMIRDERMIWADTDVFCYRPFVPREGYLVGREYGGMINNNVLFLPEDSGSLKALIECFSDPSFVPDWLPSHIREEALGFGKGRRLYEACRLIPNTAGPRAMTYMLPLHGEDHHAHPAHVLNPLPWSMADIYFNPHGGMDGWLKEDTMAIHLYTSRIRALHKRVRPLKGSFMSNFAEKIGFDLDACGLNRNAVQRDMTSSIPAYPEI
ncbi:hypothetical protein [Shimia sp. FJ5]|uniref:hypothetical protein n=1 Tax=Shimia sp. FJ5 TaxID=3079054 RepID=UPI0026342C7F|nr:hypothetical protein [Shimia sp. FJ5]MDV4146701.1 hypothetical protein [Shimia sp. FJ5]